MKLGLHGMIYSSRAEELRTFIKDKLGFSFTDIGDGWLIFNMPEADLGVYPTNTTDGASNRLANHACDRCHFGILQAFFKNT